MGDPSSAARLCRSLRGAWQVGPLSLLLASSCNGASSRPAASLPSKPSPANPGTTPRGPPLDPSQAEYWVQRCNGGDGDVCWLLADHYARGRRTWWGYFPQSNSRAAEFLAKGCNLGNTDACRDLGRVYLYGIGVEQDTARGAELLVGACDKAFALSCMDAAAALYDGKGVVRDHAHAERILTSGCSTGTAVACDLKGHLFGTGGFSDAEAPSGAPGIRFGTPLRDLEARCKASGHTWTADANGALCSGPLSDALPFPVRVSACRGRVCSVTAIIPPAGGSESVLSRVDELEKSLAEKYGLAGTRVREVAAHCLDAAALSRCVSSGEIVYESSWTWESHTRVMVSVASAKRGAAVTIAYSSPESSGQGEAQGPDEAPRALPRPRMP
ncbi:MAG TPA: tetratricopeptide repeat protein [Polyangiaceae bacterium]|nr:tetratricopeptide repeat protein [Polyangiaceae bacterium]